MSETWSFPPACPLCKGSRKLIELAKNFDKLPKFDPTEDYPAITRMLPGIGYTVPRAQCYACDGMGTTRPEEIPGFYPPPPKDFMLELSQDQKAAVDAILDWFHLSPDKRMSLAGFAGTGKTTIIAEILRRLSKKSIIKICAPTGKAASVLRSKRVPATTLHKLVYAPESFCKRCGDSVEGVRGFDGKVRCPKCKTTTIKTRWNRVPLIEADLVIVDEASMLNQSMVEDVEQLVGKILYVGDHGQLEPIGEDPGIMRNADIRLEMIHRQAAESGIIQLAHHMRRGSAPERWGGSDFGDARVVGISKLIPRVLNRYDIVLCGYNKTRKSVNAAIRGFRGFSGPLPQVGERLICLQNDSDLGIFNGLLVTVRKKRVSYEMPRYDLVDDAGNEYVDISIHPDQFAEEKKLEFVNKGIGLFDFGYCLTVHKSQGSEWGSVAVIEQIARGWDPARWRYTAATRAAERLEYWLPRGHL